MNPKTDGTDQFDLAGTTYVGTPHASLDDAIEAAKLLSQGGEPGLAVIDEKAGYFVQRATLNGEPATADRVAKAFDGLPFQEGNAKYGYSYPRLAERLTVFVDGDVVLHPAVIDVGTRIARDVLINDG